MVFESRIYPAYIFFVDYHLFIRHYIFKDCVGRNNVWNLGYEGNLDIFWLEGEPYRWGRGLLGGTEGVEDTMGIENNIDKTVEKNVKKNIRGESREHRYEERIEEIRT